MKITGIIRHIDDLGRVVIPKEVRRAMKMKEGDPLEVCIGEDYVAFKHVRDEDTCIICSKITYNIVLERFICKDCMRAIQQAQVDV